MSRQRRTELERLQVELQKARATLSPRILALEASLEEAIRLADAAAGLVARLDASRRESAERIAQLRKDLQEESVLSRGKSRRSYYLDWARRDWVVVVFFGVILIFLIVLAGLG